MAATNKLKFGQSATNCSEVFQGMVFIVTSLRRDKILSSIMTENTDRKSTRLNSSHVRTSRMPSSA